MHTVLRRVLLARSGRPRAPWRLLGQLLLLAALGFAVAVVAGVAGLPMTQLALSLVAGVVVVGSVAAAAHWLDRRPLADLGVRGPASDLGAGLAVGSLAMTGVFATELAAGWLTVTSVAGHRPPAALATGLVGGAVLMAAVAVYEELLVRGYWLTNLAEGLRWFDAATPRRAIWTAVGLTALAFGGLHATNPGATPASVGTIAAAGVVLGAAYALTDALALPVGFHAAWNYVQAFVYGLPTSGLEFGTSLVTVRQSGPAAATGGQFGPEGGLVGLAWLLAGFVGVAWWVRRTRGALAVQSSVSEPVLRR